MTFDHFKVFSGSANPTLAREICDVLGCDLGEISIKRFSDGEIYLQVLENVSGSDVFAVQPTCTPVDTHLIELLLMIDALKRASADRITAVLPYYGYARQDRKDRPRVPISAKLIASILERAGADRVLTLDLHAAQIQGFFDIPVDHLFATPVVMDYFRGKTSDMTVVSPDAGGVERARALAKRLQAPLAIIDKRRADINVAEVMHVIGDVEGAELPHRRRPDRHGGDAGPHRGCVVRARRPERVGVCHAPGALRTGDREDHRVADQGDRSDQFDPARGCGAGVGQVSGADGWAVAGQCDPIDPHGGFRQ